MADAGKNIKKQWIGTKTWCPDFLAWCHGGYNFCFLNISNAVKDYKSIENMYDMTGFQQSDKEP